MRSFRSLGIAVAMLVPLSAIDTPAYAITTEQWRNVCFDSLGLRSATSQVDVGKAGFRMDDGVAPAARAKPPPPTWDATLRSTIAFIKAYPDSGGNYLLIVQCVGTAERYGTTFPKCNSTQTPITAATPKTLSEYTDDELIDWVNANIP
ncbi:hypothetical protein [Undibacter mobilis]|uniref:Uncharacterized protein n=1 Tax=Undibacter mobilis TaxID=2292256 RepID=A0A371B2T8_9BRAD|nr:hypothetical protein [Undibacter mobilis]RDV01834.1 hypothetical protein DXH78_14485 [Undibacter mobilis]